MLDAKIMQVMKDMQEMQQCINEKKAKVDEKIGKLKEKKDAIQKEAGKHSQQWIDTQTKLIQEKIDKITEKLDKFVQEQMQKIQQWMNEASAKAQQMTTAMDNAFAEAAAKMIIPTPPELEEEDEESSEENSFYQTDEVKLQNFSEQNDTSNFINYRLPGRSVTLTSETTKSYLDQIQLEIDKVERRLSENVYYSAEYKNKDENFLDTLYDLQSDWEDYYNRVLDWEPLNMYTTQFIMEMENGNKTADEIRNMISTVQDRLSNYNYLCDNDRYFEEKNLSTLEWGLYDLEEE